MQSLRPQQFIIRQPRQRVWSPTTVLTCELTALLFISGSGPMLLFSWNSTVPPKPLFCTGCGVCRAAGRACVSNKLGSRGHRPHALLATQFLSVVQPAPCKLPSQHLCTCHNPAPHKAAGPPQQQDRHLCTAMPHFGLAVFLADGLGALPLLRLVVSRLLVPLGLGHPLAGVHLWGRGPGAPCGACVFQARQPAAAGRANGGVKSQVESAQLPEGSRS